MKSIKYLIKKISSYLVQAILGWVAFFSFDSAYELGHRTYAVEGSYQRGVGFGTNGAESETGNNYVISTGFIGGSIAMGLICSTCILMIAMIEIQKIKSTKDE
jgi:hypothetical protein